MFTSYIRLKIFYLLGLCLSAYYFYTGYKAHLADAFVTYYDENRRKNCTLVYFSPDGGIITFRRNFYENSIRAIWNPPTGILGILYYTFYSGTTIFPCNTALYGVQLIGSIMSCIFSAYANYMLYYKLGNFSALYIWAFVLNILSLFELVLIGKAIVAYINRRTKTD